MQRIHNFKAGHDLEMSLYNLCVFYSYYLNFKNSSSNNTNPKIVDNCFFESLSLLY